MESRYNLSLPQCSRRQQYPHFSKYAGTFHSQRTCQVPSANTSHLAISGMTNWLSSPTLTDCTFSQNTASVFGGGMVNVYTSSPTLINCTFSGNSGGSYGGGMVNDYYCSPMLAAVEKRLNPAV